MRDRNKNKKGSKTDFIRYQNDKMKSAERNAFEKELQKDPFAEAASEGFTLISPEEVSGDIADLKKLLKRRVEKRDRIIYYRIAASLAALMIVSSVFIIISRRSSTKQIAANMERTISPEITEVLPITEPADKTEPTAQTAIIPEKKEGRSVVNKKDQKPLIPSENEEIAAYSLIEPVNRAEVKQADEHIKSEQISALPPVMAKSKRSSVYKSEGKIISSEDNLPVAGASIVVVGEKTGVLTDSGGSFSIDLPDSNKHTLVASFIGMETKEFESKQDTPSVIKLDPSLTALNETVVTAYGISREESEMQSKPEEYVAPQPVGGKSNFDKYIRENLHWPDTLYSGQKAIVVINFSVQTDGSIDSIRIIRTPGKPFSDEAIRLLRTGPSWQPAVDNGQIIEDQVRLRIVFK